MKLKALGAVLVSFLVPAVLAGGAQESTAETVRVWLPERGWVLAVDLAGFAIESNGFRPDGRRYLRASNKGTGVVFSVTLEGARGPATLEECRRHQVARAEGKDFDKKDIEMSVEEGRSLLEYTIPQSQGVELQQRNLFVCIPREDVYVDLHLSKVKFKPEDEKHFLAILETVRFADLGTMEYLTMGSYYYLQERYDRSIPNYEQALVIDKQERRLEKNLWRVLVDNLGMAYGLTGRLEEAKATFEYGISEEPDYPLFHYNLACAYAEMGDAEHAEASLRTAFKHKANMIPGETFPDPRQDPSFQPLIQTNPKFRHFLESLAKGLGR